MKEWPSGKVRGEALWPHVEQWLPHLAARSNFKKMTLDTQRGKTDTKRSVQIGYKQDVCGRRVRTGSAARDVHDRQNE